MYASMELAVSGSGGNVDVIPVFDETGRNTRTIFDDPSLYNVEYDIITRPQGAGRDLWKDHGLGIEFENEELNSSVGYDNIPDGAKTHYDNKPNHGPSSKGEIVTIKGKNSSTEVDDDPEFQTPVHLVDNLGDRIYEIKVLSSGIYSDDRTEDSDSQNRLQWFTQTRC